MTNELEDLARAAIYADDLAIGVEGEFEVVGGAVGEQPFWEALLEVHRCQAVLVLHGWRRDKDEEARAPYSHNIERAVYRKQFEPEQPSRWVVVTLATRFGLLATFRGSKECPW